MSNFSDAAVVLPASGSFVYLRVVSQVNSSSNAFAYHPGGGMTGSLMIAGANPSRVRYTILNSGTLPMGVNHGISFDPRTNPPTPLSSYDNVINGTANLTALAAVPAVPSLAFTLDMPCYTGPVHVAWFGSGTLSGSTAIFTEFSNGR